MGKIVAVGSKLRRDREAWTRCGSGTTRSRQISTRCVGRSWAPAAGVTPW